jgi:hypothetical protein
MLTAARTATTAGGVSTAAAAVADGLAVPVLLQLGPAVLQYLREEAAGGSGGSQAGAAAVDVDLKVAVGFLVLLVVLLRHSEWGAVVYEEGVQLFAAAAATAAVEQVLVRNCYTCSLYMTVKWVRGIDRPSNRVCVRFAHNARIVALVCVWRCC